MDNDANAAKLKAYLDEGKSYFEASSLLQQEGLSQVQVEDAKNALNSQYGAKYQQAAQAAMLGQTGQTSAGTDAAESLDDDHEPERPPEYTPRGMRFMPFDIPAGGNGIVVLLAALIILIAVYILITHLH